jgi:putative transposase
MARPYPPGEDQTGNREVTGVSIRLVPRGRWAWVFPVTPATLPGWHRRLAARRYDRIVRTAAQSAGIAATAIGSVYRPIRAITPAEGSEKG